MKEIAKEFDTWVVTRAHNREAIEAERGSLPDSLHFVYLDFPGFAPYFPENTPGERLYYVAWHVLELFVAIRLHKRLQFSLVHHLTWNSFKFPGFLWLLPCHFIWGPLGGGEMIPRGFERYLGWRGRLFEWFRARLTLWSKHSFMVRRALEKASVVLVANRSTEALLPVEGTKIIRELETGVSRVHPRKKNTTSSTLRILWVGVFYPHKGFPILLEALARIPRDVAWHLTVVGDGPESQRWRRLVKRCGLSDRVLFVGWMGREQLTKYYESADVLVFTGLRDTSGNVLLEAMSHGLPVIALAHHGAGEIIGEDAGVGIPVATPEQAINSLGDALVALASDPALRHSVGQAGRRKAEEKFLWENKGERLRRLYVAVLNNGREMPLSQT